MVSMGLPYLNYSEYEHDTYYVKGTVNEDIKFIGELKKELGLNGVELDDELYRKLASGCDPKGNMLVQTGVRNTHEYKGKEVKNVSHRVGIDFTFSPDKSITLGALFSKDPRVRDAIREAHDKAVMSVANYIEKNLIQVRTLIKCTNEDGKEQKYFLRENTGNMLATAVTHYVSRDKDPQLHTHLVIYNFTKISQPTKYGFHYKAISNEKMVYNRALLNQIYDNELSYHLMQSELVVHRKYGRYTALSVDHKAVNFFSKRRKAILIAVEKLKEQFPVLPEGTLLGMAALKTRNPKDVEHLDLDKLMSVWKTEIETHKFRIEPETLTMSKNNANTPLWFVKLAIKNLLERVSTFNEQDVLSQAAEMSAGNHPYEKLLSAWKTLKKNHSLPQSEKKNYLVALGVFRGEMIFTTKEAYKSEKKIEGLYHELKEKQMPVVSRVRVLSRIENKPLTMGQKEAVQNILCGKSISVIQGYAGTGKTTMLREVKSLLKEYSSKEMIGLSFTGKAANVLNTEAGIDAMTIDGFDRSKTSLKNKVVVIDEASMLSTSHFLKVLNKIHRDTKIVLLGDFRQLQAIGPGNVFMNLIQLSNKNEVLFMKEIVRQKDDLYKGRYWKIAENMSTMQIQDAFKKLHEIGALKKVEEKPFEKMIADEYMNNRKALIVTPSNRDKDNINLEVRGRMLKDNLLVGNDHEFTVLRQKDITRTEQILWNYYSVGDVIRFNSSLPGQRNGDMEKVKEVHVDNLITVDKHGKEHKRNYYDICDNINLYSEESIHLAVGEKLTTTLNDNKLKVKNGETWTVSKIAGDEVTIKNKFKTVKINLEEYKHLDYGYAVTNFKAQGMTAEKVICYFDVAKEHMNKMNSVYVAATRGKKEISVYSNDFSKLVEQAQEVEIKKSIREVQADIQQEKKGIVNLSKDEWQKLWKKLEEAKEKEGVDDPLKYSLEAIRNFDIREYRINIQNMEKEMEKYFLKEKSQEKGKDNSQGREMSL
jgi:conjugative relaxase-like TrwC/TraI family protein